MLEVFIGLFSYWINGPLPGQCLDRLRTGSFDGIWIEDFSVVQSRRGFRWLVVHLLKISWSWLPLTPVLLAMSVVEDSKCWNVSLVLYHVCPCSSKQIFILFSKHLLWMLWEIQNNFCPAYKPHFTPTFQLNLPSWVLEKWEQIWTKPCKKLRISMTILGILKTYPQRLLCLIYCPPFTDVVFKMHNMYAGKDLLIFKCYIHIYQKESWK